MSKELCISELTVVKNIFNPFLVQDDFNSTNFERNFVFIVFSCFSPKAIYPQSYRTLKR